MNEERTFSNKMKIAKFNYLINEVTCDRNVKLNLELI